MPKKSPLRSVEELYAQRNKYHKKVDRNFVAYDGEGITQVVHKYVLLMNSTGDKLVDFDGISTEDALNFLCDSSRKNKNSIHVCYGASYDVNMMLRDVPYPRLKKLQKGEKIGFLNFTLEYRQRKCFIVTRYEPNSKHYIQDEKGEWHSQHLDRITLWDVIGFFQGSFVKALKEFFPDIQEQVDLHLEEIIEGKKDRGTFTKDIVHDFVIPYTEYEVSALVQLMIRFRQYCNEAGINLKRYDGAGAAAAALLEKYKVKQYYGTVVKEKKKLYIPGEIPPDVMRASQHAYGGGRIEMCKIGHMKQIKHYDIISAYPSVMPYLVNLKNGRWYHTKKNFSFSNPFSLYKIYWEYPFHLPFYPFFYRDIGSVIRFPAKGYNWVWFPELKAAMRHQEQMRGIIDIKEQWQYEPADNIKPYEFVPDLFQKRREWKDKGLGAQIPLKLALNSFYGKTVQRLGYEEDTGKLPPFFQLQYGGYITSSIRAKMFEAAMSSPQTVLAFATDGIWSTEQLQVPISKMLGEWEYEELDSITMIQAGVYFSHKTIDKPQYNMNGELINCPLHGPLCEEVHKYRGFNEGSIKEDIILQAWQDNLTELAIPTKRFITLGTGIASKERYKEKWRQWEEDDRILRLKPRMSEKRYDTSLWTEDFNPAKRLIDTSVTEVENMVYASRTRIKAANLSLKHVLPWEHDDKNENIEYKEAVQAEIWESDT